MDPFLPQPLVLRAAVGAAEARLHAEKALLGEPVVSRAEKTEGFSPCATFVRIAACPCPTASSMAAGGMLLSWLAVRLVGACTSIPSLASMRVSPAKYPRSFLCGGRSRRAASGFSWISRGRRKPNCHPCLYPGYSRRCGRRDNRSDGFPLFYRSCGDGFDGPGTWAVRASVVVVAFARIDP